MKTISGLFILTNSPLIIRKTFTHSVMPSPDGLYCAVWEEYSIFEEEVQRLSNNNRPQFTDEETITTYILGIQSGHYEKKAIYNFIQAH